MNFSLYSSQQEENIFIRKQAKTWLRSGLITPDQLGVITDATDPNLRQTNLFFRILFFIFTLLCTGTLVGLFAWLISKGGNTDEMFLAAILIFFSAIYYMAAEYMVSVRRFYRYGIEEALALVAMELFCAGCGWLLSKYGLSNKEITIAVLALVTITASWIYLRFGYLYAALISLIAACFIPFQLSLPPTGERVLLLIILCLIFFLNVIYDKPEIEDFRKERNTTIQADLLIAIYLTVNLHLLSVAGIFLGRASSINLYLKLFPPYIYWLSYILTFMIPALGIYWGIKSRKRLILNASLVLACLTLATNKSYLGLTRYAWDPAILGIMLIGISIIISRWLKRGQDGNRYGFTESNILKPESHGISLSDVAAAFTPNFIDAQQPPSQPGKYFDGGSSGGGGASRDF